MKAVRIHGRGGPEHLVYEDIPQPQPGPGEVLVRVYAAGVIAPELTWDETYVTSKGVSRPLPIPGHDVTGVVEAVGAGVSEPNVGTAVYGLTAFDRDGSAAEYMLALPDELTQKPLLLDYVQAAAVPLTALTVWQALFEHGSLMAGQKLLIHGAAGGVGVFAVQLAHWTGAYVIGTSSERNENFLYDLGVNEVIDYTRIRFEDAIQEVDMVLDMVGGDTLDRSWQVLKKGGVLISVANPPSVEEAKAHGVRSVWFIVEPNRLQLHQIGELIDAGKIRPVIDTVFPLSQARQAYEQGAKGHTRGKIVLRVKD
ncbi:NADP-dependent oxidoreductase [Dictyobacter formicarum]|uniref:NADPH:quinone reductase n=1 Tax=Dictyobacter formicarum TaxID=2778368 RepID=A0ABQ3VL37_9CHLR|nr:NADP-dependent oxidoreductase [Dictyobacter formicarum]GHO86376.1 NADPH:quinone reductase [Dictyobacter formicarum]